jgi:ABC-type glycerol-3-phosphate transport system substrate-binding protein
MSTWKSTTLTRRAVLGGGIAALGAVGLAACTPTSPGTSTKSAKKTLNVAFFGTQAEAAAASKVSAPFIKAHPGVKVNFKATNGTDWNDFFAKLLTQIAAGAAPDIVGVATEGVQLFAQKSLAHPLDEFVTRDKSELRSFFKDVHPSLIEAMMYKGHLYELPTNFNAGNMYFNNSVMAQSSLQLPPADWTMDDFQAMAKSMAPASGAIPFDWVVRLWGSWTSFLYANGGNLLEEGKYPGGSWMWDTFYKNDPAAKGRAGGFKWGDPTATSASVEEALDYVIQLTKDGLSTQPDVGGGSTIQGLFASNKVGMTIGGGFWAGGLHNAGMKSDAFDVQYFPKWKTQRALFGTGGYGMLESTKDKDLAWEFLKSLVSVSSLNVLTDGNTTTPSRRSMMTAERYSTTGPANWKVYYDTLDKYPNTTPIPAPPYYNALATALNQRTTQATASGNAKLALQGLQQDLETAATGTN